jgi:hypothetical protein
MFYNPEKCFGIRYFKGIFCFKRRAKSHQKINLINIFKLKELYKKELPKEIQAGVV